ncbi:MAG: cob(I)yrinic acid a,c-diamide adenosyltransferase [Rikenellaceae bacterium]
MEKETGLVHVYTGDGKGKTTAAIGLAARALGGGLTVLYVSFHKQPEKYGYTEMDSLKKLGATVLNRAKGHPHLDTSLDNDLIKEEANKAVDEIAAMICQQHFDLLIMDEILISVRDNYIEEQLLIDFIKNKPATTELVLTGRSATQAVMELADYVSFVKCEKHPYNRGVLSRKGIEF